MAKIKIPFNGTDYSIDESALASAKDSLKTHLSTVMNGSGGGGTPEIAVGKTVTFKESYVIDESITNINGQSMQASTIGIRVDVVSDSAFMIIVMAPVVINGEQLGEGAFYFNEGAVELGVGADFGIVNAEEGWYYSPLDGTIPIKMDNPLSVLIQTELDAQLISVTSFLFASTSGNTTITLDGVSYSVDPTKLSTVTDGFVAHIGTLSGEGGLEPITWDGVVGDKFTAMNGSLVKVSDTVLSREDFVGSTITISNGESLLVNENLVFPEEGVFIVGEMNVVSFPQDTFVDSELVYEAGTYFSNNPNNGLYTNSITFAGGSAGGDTKLTVNGAEYLVDSTKLSDAIADLHEALERLSE